MKNFPSGLFGNKKDDVKSKEYLYFCPECLREQYKRNGEGYWNRIHQIPGILVCRIHLVVLSRHSLDIHNVRDNKFILPTLNDIKKVNNDYNPDVMNALIRLAEDVEYLLEKNYELLPEDYFHNKYVTLLEIKGVAYPILEREVRLKNLISNFYPLEFLELLDSSFLNNSNSSWVPKFAGVKDINLLHPIRHLLLMRLLCGSAREFFENDYTYRPFGTGPWICMNPLADHYLQKVVEKVEVSIHKSKRIIQGDMVCSCGFIYRLRNWERSPLDVEFFNNRIMKKGHVWEQKFNEFLEQELTKKEIAYRTNMTTPTIRKILRDRKQFSERELKEVKKNQIRDTKTIEYKKTWLELRAKYPQYHRNELSALNRAAYAWLRKYEKDWIEDNSPPLKTKINVKEKPYLLEIDEKLLSKAKNIIMEWPEYEKAKNKLIRKSKHKIMNLLGLFGNFESLKKRYVLTTTFIELNGESVDTFRRRRVRNILDVKYKNQEVTVYKVIRASHLRECIKNGEKEIIEYIEELVEKHNLDIK